MYDQVKEVQRNASISIRKRLPEEWQLAASSNVCKGIARLKEYREAKHIALYMPLGGEINLEMIWNSAPLQGKYCYFPVIHEKNKLIFLPATPKTPFKKNQYGILEPDVDLALFVPIERLDLIFMPLVCFDLKGTRLGMGKGYYDRSLANQSYKTLIGVAYEFQKQDYIQREAWDIPLSLVATEEQIYDCRLDPASDLS